MLSFDWNGAAEFLPRNWMDEKTESLKEVSKRLRDGTCSGGAYTGWVDYPEQYDRREFERLLKCAERIRSTSDVLVVCGIGGSYLGARAAYELLASENTYGTHRSGTELVFAGNTLSSDAMSELLGFLRKRDFCVNVISKSGTTVEPSVAFMLLKDMLEEKYGEDGAKERIIATTDAKSGILRQLATDKGYETFTVPDHIGGRYSVLTSVGLLPLAAAGLRVDELLSGAAQMREVSFEENWNNPAWQYAGIRNALYQQGKQIEVLACFEPSFRFFAEWWKQLYGESEGKSGKGLFPASVEFTADLHSMGQYIQQGPRSMFETVVRFVKPRHDIRLNVKPGDKSGLDYLDGKMLSFVNEQARIGTAMAHVHGGVPNLRIDVPERTERWIGALIYFFEYACGLSGGLLGVNPFDQPGVEEYKKNMFELLGRPGYERTDTENRILLQG